MIASTSSRAPAGARRSKLLPSLGILLVTGGILLLLWFAWLWFNPGPAPYRYQLVEEGDVDKFSQLGLTAWPDLKLAKYEVYAEGVDKPLAVTHIARQGTDSPVLLDWENRTSELLLTTDNKLSELTALATAINKYAAKDALVLAWWDTSRQIRLLAGRDTLFTQRVGEPLIVPPHWQDQMDAIRHYENEFWDASASAEEQRKFQRFADALLAEPQEGAAILRELAGMDGAGKGDKTPREAYIAIHVTDLYKLGLMRPAQFDMAYKNFPMEGNMHGMIGYLKSWMQENGFKTHTLQSLSDKMVRGYFLRDAQSSNTLIAQMLPFTESRPLDLTAVQLIYQQGGYWVYQIPPAGGMPPSETPAPEATPSSDAASPDAAASSSPAAGS